MKVKVRLGGFAVLLRTAPDVLWRDASFRGYAGHLRIPEALDALTELAVEGLDTAVLCSETVWWRCHRRLVADALLLLTTCPCSACCRAGSRGTCRQKVRVGWTMCWCTTAAARS